MRASVPEDAGRNVTTTTNGDHEVGVKVLQDYVRGGLTELVDLVNLLDKVQKKLWTDKTICSFAGVQISGSLWISLSLIDRVIVIESYRLGYILTWL